MNLTLALTMLFLASCGGSAPAAEGTDPAATPTAGGEHEVDVAALAARDFDSLSPEEKGDFMEHVVMPAMKPLFQGFDAEDFSHFSCATCHGRDAREVNFRMPNGVEPLDPAHMPAEDGEKGRAMHFMEEQVKPRMAELLHQTQWSPTNPQGFGCFNCHAMVTPPAAPAAGAAVAPATTPAVAAPAADDDHDGDEHAEHGDDEHAEHGEAAEHAAHPAHGGHGRHH